MGPVIAEMPQRAEQRSAQRIALGSLPTSDDVKRTTWFIFVLLILLLLAIFVVGYSLPSVFYLIPIFIGTRQRDVLFGRPGRFLGSTNSLTPFEDIPG